MKSDEQHDHDVRERNRDNKKSGDEIFVRVKLNKIRVNSACC